MIDRRPVEAAAAEALLRGDRTPMQLSERARDRWVSYGYRARLASEQLANPTGAAISLWRPGPCPDPRCDDGRTVDTGADCPRCEERRASFRAQHRIPAARTAEPVGVQERLDVEQRPAGPARVECADCKRPMPAGGDPRCRECREARALLVDVLGTPDAASAVDALPVDVREELADLVATEGTAVLSEALSAALLEAGVDLPSVITEQDVQEGP